MEPGHGGIPGTGEAGAPRGWASRGAGRGRAAGAAAAEAARALELDLRRVVEGEVRFDAGSRALYATDASNYRQVPIGVVVPRTVADVVATVATCRRHGAPVLSRGGGTSLAGQCCNVAVVLDFSKYLGRILELDPARRVARVEPGCVLDRLRDAAERHHLTFGPDPATHTHCTLGGMIGNDSCGVHSVLAGRTSDNVERLRVLTYGGLEAWVGAMGPAEIEDAVHGGGPLGELVHGLVQLRDRYAALVRARYPPIPRRVSGYNLEALLPERGFHVARSLVGSEGTLVTILEAEVRLVPSPPGRALLVLGYPDVFAAADDVPALLRLSPIGLEGMDDLLVDDVRKKRLHPSGLARLPDGGGFLLVELGGADRREAAARARRAMATLGSRPHPPQMRLYDDPADAAFVWKVRESSLGATTRVPGEPDTWEGWEDSAVAPERLGEYLRSLRALYRKYGYQGAFYGHFGQGCVHTRTTFDLATRDGIRRYRAFVEEAADLVVSLGGSLSGEHGDGQSRGELLVRMFGPELVEAFREVKSLWDPDWKMNPGKKVEPYRLDEHLRLGEGFVEAAPPTRFAFSGDDGRLGRAAARCVGVGACRRDQGGVMCPSYRVTREEQHSTRGRAHLLYEVLQKGDPLGGGWRSEAVKEALDLCLACKGCKSDCPVSVDVATYRAEFLSHYYEGRRRPRAAYAMGLVMEWARLAALAPGLVNVAGRAPGVARLVKAAAGIAPERALPRFAPVTFRRWFSRRPRRGSARRVLLFPDTFTDFFDPGIGVAAVEVLESAGYEVVLPRRRICCGRPLYDHGMLGLARAFLRRDLAALEPELRAGTPVVFLEPSCAAVFRDELPELLPRHPLARTLAGATRLLSELVEEDPAFPVARLDREALLQVHCHQHAVLGDAAERRVLARLGLRVDDPDAGCCGMAGAFGFEAGERHRVSVAVGERVLLPRVRAAPATTLLLADGFSCRTQIAQETGRRALHLAEALRLAQEPAPPADAERWARRRRLRAPAGLLLARGVALALAVAGLGRIVRGRWGRR